jgi:hypothetical protein
MHIIEIPRNRWVQSQFLIAIAIISAPFIFAIGVERGAHAGFFLAFLIWTPLVIGYLWSVYSRPTNICIDPLNRLIRLQMKPFLGKNRDKQLSMDLFGAVRGYYDGVNQETYWVELVTRSTGEGLRLAQFPSAGKWFSFHTVVEPPPAKILREKIAQACNLKDLGGLVQCAPTTQIKI